MPEIGNTYTTLMDVAKTLDPQSRAAVVAEVLSKINEILGTIHMGPGNHPKGNQVTYRTSEPAPERRRINRGVGIGKATTEQFVDTMGAYELYVPVDVRAIPPGADVNAFRFQQARAVINGFSKKVVDDLFYGNEAITQDGFTGLTPRYNSLGGKFGGQIVDCGGTGGNNTSIWILTTGEDYTFAMYPTGSAAGIFHENQGEKDWPDPAAPYKFFKAWVDFFKWDIGLTVNDYRGNVRLANIDVPSLANAGKAAYSGPDLALYLIDAMVKLPVDHNARRFIYCNPTVAAALRKIALSKAASTVTIETFNGRPVTHVDGIPVMRVDGIYNSEARVV